MIRPASSSFQYSPSIVNVRVGASHVAVTTARYGGLLIVHDPLADGSAAARGSPSPSIPAAGPGSGGGNCPPQPSTPASISATAPATPISPRVMAHHLL